MTPKKSEKNAGVAAKKTSDKIRGNPLVSIILPVFNKEFVIARTCREISLYLESNSYEYEIIAVDDGSSDASVAVMRKALEGKRASIIELGSNHGKGYAVREACLQAAGDLVVVVDADHAIDIDHLPAFAKVILEEGYDLAIGSRFISGSHFIDPRPYRAILSRSLNFLVRRGLPINFRDTQCGFKVLGRRAASELMPQTRIDRFLIDVELLYLAALNGYRVKEVPVDCVITPRSSIRLVRDPIQMIFDLLELMRRYRNESKK